MHNGNDFYVSTDTFFKALRLEGKARKAMQEILAESGVLVEIHKEIFISVRPYIQIALSALTEIGNLAEKSPKYNDLWSYRTFATTSLQEWSVIIEHLSYHLAKEHRFKSKDETVKLYERLTDSLRKIFNHFIKANKLLVEYGQSQKGASASNKSKK